MNEQTQQALADLLSLAVEGVNGAVEFSKAQLPEVVEQLLMWNMVESLIFFVSGALLVIFTTWASLKIHKAVQNDTLDELAYAVAVPVSFFTIAGGFVTVVSNLSWLKILIAPKLYLLEYAAQLVK